MKKSCTGYNQSDALQSHNHFLNVLGSFDALPNFSLTTSETRLDNYL